MTYQAHESSFRNERAFPLQLDLPTAASQVASAPLVSLVVPVKDEQEAIIPFVERVTAVLEEVTGGEPWEILFVDDGSRDATLAAVIAAHHRDSRVKVISLSRNFGKEAALSAGLDFACGQAVVPIDVDLQDPPEALGDMLSKWRQGYEVVYGIRRCRASDQPLKRLSADFYYRAHNWLSRDKIPAHAGDFRLLDRKVVDIIRKLPERNRFMKGLFAWSGFRQVAVEYDRAERAVGDTKFSYWKLWSLALDGITSSSTVPLKMWSYLGGAIALFALAYSAFIVMQALVIGSRVDGYPSLIASVLFLGGIQLISLGVLGEYVGRILVETKQRPIYVLRDQIGVTGAGNAT